MDLSCLRNTTLRSLAIVALGIAMAPAVGRGAPAATDDPGTAPLWLESSLVRVFPTSPPGTSQSLELLAGRNYRLSFQACIQNRTPQPLEVSCEVTSTAQVQARVRRVGYVPMPNHNTDTPKNELDGIGFIPGLVPDPLYPESKATVGPWGTQSFWVSVVIPASTAPGTYPIEVALQCGKDSPRPSMTAKVEVLPFVVEKRKNFPVTHWWFPDSIYDWHKTEVFDEKWWALARAYVTNMVEHGSSTVMVPMLHGRVDMPPRIGQMLKVKRTAPDKYEFDFSDTRRFLRMALECGAENLEWWHFFMGWGAAHPIRVEGLENGKLVDLWAADAPATTGTYRLFLEQFLPEFQKVLEEEGVLERSFFHVSDEPSGEEHFKNYQRARALLKELAPWMKVMDAISEVKYGKTGLIDIPVPILNTAHDFREAGIPHWVYFCCGPRGGHLNRLLDTPLTKIRMSGWLFYRLEAQGFLHWGYNYWRRFHTWKEMIDPFRQSDGDAWPNIPYGDTFVVYPGTNGPLDSIRWEIFAESLQDYAVLQTAGIKPDDALLAPIKSYAEFPKESRWVLETLKQVMSEAP